MKELNAKEIEMVAGGLAAARIRSGTLGNYGGWSALAGGVVGGLIGGPLGAVVGAALGASMGRF